MLYEEEEKNTQPFKTKINNLPFAITKFNKNINFMRIIILSVFSNNLKYKFLFCYTELRKK